MAAARSAVGTSLGVAAAAGVAALAWGTLVERTMFTVRHEQLPLLPPGARPITILHLSDLHLAPWQEKKIEWVRSLALYEPDLVVNTGDNLGHEDATRRWKRLWRPSRASRASSSTAPTITSAPA